MSLARYAPTLLLLLLPLAGCGNLRDDVKRDWWEADEPDAPFLGVVVSKPSGERACQVEAVLRESPAAAMGIAPGDAIVRYGALPVSSPAELRSAMRRVDAGRSGVDVTVARGFRSEVVLHGEITRQSSYAEKATAALEAAEVKGKTHVPFLFRFCDWRIEPAVWAAWTGYTPSEDVVGYSETNILPILDLVCIFRYESTPCLEDRARFQFLSWPIIYSSSAGDEEDERAEIGAARLSQRQRQGDSGDLPRERL
jgi:hypothetical protein